MRQRQARESVRRAPSAAPKERQTRARQYRLKAEELREIADDVILFESKQTLVSLANSYEHLADTVEHTEHPHDNQPNSA